MHQPNGQATNAFGDRGVGVARGSRRDCRIHNEALASGEWRDPAAHDDRCGETAGLVVCQPPGTVAPGGSAGQVDARPIAIELSKCTAHLLYCRLAVRALPAQDVGVAMRKDDNGRISVWTYSDGFAQRALGGRETIVPLVATAVQGQNHGPTALGAPVPRHIDGERYSTPSKTTDRSKKPVSCRAQAAGEAARATNATVATSSPLPDESAGL